MVVGSDGMKKTIKFLRENWIKLWIVVVVLALSGVVTYAAFTRINIVKRVISTDEGVGDRFSSDYMQSSGVFKTRETKNSQTDIPEVSVHVFNYPYPKSAFYRNSETTYKLTARLGTMNGNVFTPLNTASLPQEEAALLNAGGYKIALGSDVKTFTSTVLNAEFNSCTIAAGAAYSNEFTLTFDINEVSDNPKEYYMELVASPDDSELPTLRGYVSVRYAQTATSGWSGKLETLDASKSYDGFNYILTGTGSGEITFKWKSEFVLINKQFLENKNYSFKINGAVQKGSSTVKTYVDNLQPDESGYKSLTLVVDSTKNNRYEVQFFKTWASGADYTNSISDYLPSTTESDWKADVD